MEKHIQLINLEKNQEVRNIFEKTIDEEMFKLYLSDVGLLTSISEIKYLDIMLERIFEFKGAITENYIAQEFVAKDTSLYYWTYGRNAEIDFIIYNEDGIIPVEVKSGNNIKSIPLYATFLI